MRMKEHIDPLGILLSNLTLVTEEMTRTSRSDRHTTYFLHSAVHQRRHRRLHAHKAPPSVSVHAENQDRNVCWQRV